MLHICLTNLEPGVSKELPNWDDAAEWGVSKESPKPATNGRLRSPKKYR